MSKKHLPAVSTLWHSIHVIWVYLLHFQEFYLFNLWGVFSLMSSSFHFPGLKFILLFRLILCRMEFWWLKKTNLIIIFLIFMFCAIRLKLNIPTFYTTGNKRQLNLFLPSYVLFIIFALWRQPHSVSRKLCVKEWPLPPPLHPWSHLYFCAFLHRHVCLNADGIKILLLPQSISVFLFVATDQSHVLIVK